MKGWIYVIANKAMPGLIKVGYSMKDPELRAAELNHTGSPHPYVVDYEALVEEPRDVEQMVHGHLRDRREGKEWFRCSAEEAIAAIQSVVGPRAQVENFKHADRTKAEAIKQHHQAEERARRVAEEERQKREAILDAKRQEIISRYEPSLKGALPSTYFWAYFAGVFIALMIAITIFFPEVKDAGMFMFLTIGAFVIAPFVKNKFEENAKESVQYKSILAKREAELAAVETERVVATIPSRAGNGLLERRSIPVEPTPVSAESKMDHQCVYYGCGKTADNSYKGAWYCPEHGKVMRAQRFALARRLRDR